jgi:hypothetical protein
MNEDNGTTVIRVARQPRRRKRWGSYMGTLSQRAIAAAELVREGWSQKEAAATCCVNAGYVSLVRRLTPEDRVQLAHNKVTLAELYRAYRHRLAERRAQRPFEWKSPADENIDRLIAKFGADRVMAALDRATQPERAAAE